MKVKKRIQSNRPSIHKKRNTQSKVFPIVFSAIVVLSIFLFAILASKSGSSNKLVQDDSGKLTPAEVKVDETISYEKLRLQAKQAQPESEKFNRNGIAIILSSEAVSGLKNLKEFVEHKKKMGLNPLIITEKDFGRSTGEEAAHNIRNWLKENYIKKNILYALFIGDPHPQRGDVPMKMLSDPYKATAEETPTDFFYVDLTGTFDLNNNGVDGEPEDYGKKDQGGMDCKWDILVGRIPCYQVKDGGLGYPAADEILQKTMDYENETDIRWRYNFLITSFNKHLPQEVLDDNGIDYLIAGGFGEGGGDRGKDSTNFDNKTIDLYDADNMEILRDVNPGGIRVGGHGNTTFCGGLVSHKVVELLKTDKPSLIQLGGCQVAHPEMANNLTYSLLYRGAIGVYGGTRSVTSYFAWLGGKKVGARPQCREFAERCFLEACSQSYALWESYSEITEWSSGHINATMLLINLYGDPSVRPFPYGSKAPYAVDILPTHTKRLDGNSASTMKVSFKIKNTTNKELRLNVSSDRDWLKPIKEDVLIPSQQTKTINCTVIKNNLPKGGFHQAQVRFSGDAGVNRVRNIEIVLPGEKQTVPKGNKSPIVKHGTLTKAKVSDMNWMVNLNQFVNEPEGERVRFQAIDVPSWIIVHRDGQLQTPFGPPKSDLGWQSIKVKVSDIHGLSSVINLKVEVIKNQKKNL